MASSPALVITSFVMFSTMKTLACIWRCTSVLIFFSANYLPMPNNKYHIKSWHKLMEGGYIILLTICVMNISHILCAITVAAKLFGPQCLQLCTLFGLQLFWIARNVSFFSRCGLSSVKVTPLDKISYFYVSYIFGRVVVILINFLLAWSTYCKHILDSFWPLFQGTLN